MLAIKLGSKSSHQFLHGFQVLTGPGTLACIVRLDCSDIPSSSLNTAILPHLPSARGPRNSHMGTSRDCCSVLIVLARQTREEEDRP